MRFVYESGEQIKKGDRVLLHGNPGEIEEIADPAKNPDDWLVKQYGGGVMVIEPKVFGRLFLKLADFPSQELTFVSRSSEGISN
ncbi:MAG TPA: hypothetical protein VNV82_17650 [Bryobacteraceae bacterium]|jgi:hypothetical protein|nr:hypothetical protein [Bryobacteraceae bacterium]